MYCRRVDGIRIKGSGRLEVRNGVRRFRWWTIWMLWF